MAATRVRTATSQLRMTHSFGEGVIQPGLSKRATSAPVSRICPRVRRYQ